jgi:hypothetical protein
LIITTRIVCVQKILSKISRDGENGGEARTPPTGHSICMIDAATTTKRKSERRAKENGIFIDPVFPSR